MFLSCAENAHNGNVYTHLSSWGSSFTYSILKEGTTVFSCKNLGNNKHFKRRLVSFICTIKVAGSYHFHWHILHILRDGIIKCATIEEIEAEKSVIEKDAVSCCDYLDVRLILKWLYQISISSIIFQRDRMERTIETVRTSFNAVRTGRANPSMLDRVEVCHLSC